MKTTTLKPIAIHSAPRSGSSWLGQIINSHPNVVYKFQPLFSYEFKNFISETSTKENLINFFNTLSNYNTPFLNQTQEQLKGIIPIFEKHTPFTHFLYKEVRYHYLLEQMLKLIPSFKVVIIIRNPMSSITSWLKAPREFRKDLGWKIISEWEKATLKNNGQKENYFGYEKWKESTLLFEKLAENFKIQVKIITYYELLINTENTVKNLCIFLELNFHKNMKKFITDSKTNEINDYYSVYKIKKNDDAWKDFLPNYIIQKIYKDLTKSSLSKYLTSI